MPFDAIDIACATGTNGRRCKKTFIKQAPQANAESAFAKKQTDTQQTNGDFYGSHYLQYDNDDKHNDCQRKADAPREAFLCRADIFRMLATYEKTCKDKGRRVARRYQDTNEKIEKKKGNEKFGETKIVR